MTESANPRRARVLRRLAHPTAIVAIAVLLGAGLIATTWHEQRVARDDLRALARTQASAVRSLVVVAARQRHAAAQQAREALVERLRDAAHALLTLDDRGRLTSHDLERLAARNHLFRVSVVAPDGQRELTAGTSGRGRQGGQAAPPGPGMGPGSHVLIERIVGGGEQEVVTAPVTGRRGGIVRLALGVRRGNGGALLLSTNAQATDVIERRVSLDALVSDIVAATPTIAYVALEHDGHAFMHAAPSARDYLGDVVADARMGEHVEPVGNKSVLELNETITFDQAPPARLRIAMWLDEWDAVVHRTWRRTLGSVASAILVGALGLGLIWLQKDYGRLAEAHARARKALEQRDRLAAMGELSATVAHEIRNPLNAIAMSAQRLEKEMAAMPASPGDASALLDVIRTQVRRLDARIHQFLQHARPPSLTKTARRFDEWLLPIVNGVRAVAAARDVDLQYRCRDTRPVHVDADQMGQVIENLIRNAIDASPAHGCVRVEASGEGADALVSVIDVGAGIPAATRTRIFDLYFTTKPGGTGVGLAVAMQIAAAHGGRIEVLDTAPPPGTTMVVRWPRALET